MRVSLWPAVLPCEMNSMSVDAKVHQAACSAGMRGTCEWASVPCAGGCHHSLQQTCLIKRGLFRPAGCPREGRVHASRQGRMGEWTHSVQWDVAVIMG